MKKCSSEMHQYELTDPVVAWHSTAASFIIHLIEIDLLTPQAAVKWNSQFQKNYKKVHFTWGKNMINTQLPFATKIKKVLHSGILLPKLFWPIVRKNCSSDRENFSNSRPSASNFKQWKDRTIFGNRMVF